MTANGDEQMLILTRGVASPILLHSKIIFQEPPRKMSYQAATVKAGTRISW